MKVTPLMTLALIYILGLLLGLFLIAIDPIGKTPLPPTETPLQRTIYPDMHQDTP